MNSVCKRRLNRLWMKVWWACVWVKWSELSCLALWHLFWLLRCPFFPSSFLILVRADVIAFNKSQDRKYVEYLILVGGTLPLGHLVFVVNVIHLYHLSETQIYNKVLLIKFPDIFPSVLLWKWIMQVNELSIKLLIAKACFSDFYSNLYHGWSMQFQNQFNVDNISRYSAVSLNVCSWSLQHILWDTIFVRHCARHCPCSE